jgi:FkbH-like protein
MSPSIYAELSWLSQPPVDYNARCRRLLDDQGDLGGAVRSLANHRLDENQLFRLSRAIAKAKGAHRSLNPLSPFRLGLVSNATTDFLVPAIAATAARHGIAVEVISSEYGQVMQEVLSPESAIHGGRPDAVLLAIDHRWYPFHPCPGEIEQADAVVDRCFAQLEAIRDGIKAHSGAACIFQTLAPPTESLFGSLDRALPGTTHYLIDRFNVRLADMVRGSEDVLFDVAGLAQIVGLAEWHSPTSWNLAKVPFSHAFLPLYADHVGRLLGSLRGKSRRCLILDLDNTVWGGVVGDDGVEGIQIAQGDATGEAFLDVQRVALALRSRGIILAISSKNTDEIARRPFQEHPEMLLKLDHIAVFQANWNDKATNITAIAGELSLGLESMVFLDDNPVERGLVRQMLPAVAVPELPADPALYARTLIAAGYFESTRFSEEDMKRAKFYHDNSRRLALQQQTGDINAYLASLNMEIVFQPFNETGRARITQLISKSNQFNLTSRRYSEAEVATFQNDPQYFTLQVRLSDTFGDNGMISVIICRRVDAETLEFDTWLMSCRVLGRRVENLVLQEVVQYAQAHRFRRLLGHYIPTDRNALVERHYEKLGFDKVGAREDGATVWELDVTAATPYVAPVSIKRVGFEVTEAISA